MAFAMRRARLNDDYLLPVLKETDLIVYLQYDACCDKG